MDFVVLQRRVGDSLKDSSDIEMKQYNPGFVDVLDMSSEDCIEIWQ